MNEAIIKRDYIYGGKVIWEKYDADNNILTFSIPRSCWGLSYSYFIQFNNIGSNENFDFKFSRKEAQYIKQDNDLEYFLVLSLSNDYENLIGAGIGDTKRINTDVKYIIILRRGEILDIRSRK